MAKPRDRRAEYARRIERGLARGLSRAQARGHPRAGEPFLSGARPRGWDPRLDAGLRMVRDEGASAAEAARTIGEDPRRLREYIHRSGVEVEHEHGRLAIGEDPRIREMAIYSHGKRVTVRLYLDESRHAGAYMSAVGQALTRNSPVPLMPYEDDVIVDVDGTRYPVEVRMNVLYRLDQMRDEGPITIYKIVA